MAAIDSVSSRDVKSAVSVSMMRKQQDQEKEVAKTLLSNIDENPRPPANNSPRGVGEKVNVRA